MQQCERQSPLDSPFLLVFAFNSVNVNHCCTALLVFTDISTSVNHRCTARSSCVYRQQCERQPLLYSPFFPLDHLKQQMMELLDEAVQKGAAHIRDPIGGSNECLFV